MMYPDCEICGEDSGRHTMTKNGEKLQVCTACFMNEVGEAF